jgi:hypothetical protein
MDPPRMETPFRRQTMDITQEVAATAKPWKRSMEDMERIPEQSI